MRNCSQTLNFIYVMVHCKDGAPAIFCFPLVLFALIEINVFYVYFRPMRHVKVSSSCNFVGRWDCWKSIYVGNCSVI